MLLFSIFGFREKCSLVSQGLAYLYQRSRALLPGKRKRLPRAVLLPLSFDLAGDRLGQRSQLESPVSQTPLNVLAYPRISGRTGADPWLTGSYPHLVSLVSLR